MLKTADEIAYSVLTKIALSNEFLARALKNNDWRTLVKGVKGEIPVDQVGRVMEDARHSKPLIMKQLRMRNATKPLASPRQFDPDAADARHLANMAKIEELSSQGIPSEQIRRILDL